MNKLRYFKMPYTKGANKRVEKLFVKGKDRVKYTMTRNDNNNNNSSKQV